MVPSADIPRTASAPANPAADETVARWGRPMTALVWFAVIASGLIFVLALSAPVWVAWLEPYEAFRWLADVVIDFLQRFYHEPEMDIVQAKRRWPA